MTPTHTNKRGARYRYYVSHALLQKRNDKAGSVPRVPAPEIESLVLKALSEHLSGSEDPEQLTVVNDRDQIERQLDRIVVQADALEIHLAGSREHPKGTSTDRSSSSEAGNAPPSVIAVPWSPPLSRRSRASFIPPLHVQSSVQKRAALCLAPL
jgi:hypothetical protein